ncbi:MAG: 5-oxoprolinase subunit PxpA [Liquorilactobacillus nagelii]|uniref:LamB/YcsF family protein n=1 Tax=Liquorilactobacillus nagelii TaxID=82688 RepID=UPI002431EF53|nr:5-oxoprolinase subunit PxpA [Liquorilactobacillus nagelii]MCI1633063.1 5-oxoprolinase subunit PxpA [Liquorilactobacillus nagelii]MCI1921268.1 5-oxoprolinase subunit PxpA [Liquorilactobacillus nagelii]MCI1975853.1 5-oxoprolinase subunit PxpA [Liquorilactobacillus nagelii]
MMKIDLNSDLGESFGRYQLGNDSQVIQLVTSVNVACGFHAGDPDVMAQTVATAQKAGVGIGAHPGFPDLQGFGRRKMQLSPLEVQHLVTYQVGALQAFTSKHRLHHVKPHGALYNLAASNHQLAVAICRGIQQVDPQLPLYGLAGSELIKAAAEVDLPVAQEVFGDRNYLPDGRLVPRSQSDAVITDPKLIAQRVVQMVKKRTITTIDGSEIKIDPDTVCVHGDNQQALAIVKQLRQTLTQSGIDLQPF